MKEGYEEDFDVAEANLRFIAYKETDHMIKFGKMQYRRGLLAGIVWALMGVLGLILIMVLL